MVWCCNAIRGRLHLQAASGQGFRARRWRFFASWLWCVPRLPSPIHSLRRSSAATRGNEARSWLLAAAEYATRSPTLKLTNPRAFCFGKPGSSRRDVGKPFVKCPESGVLTPVEEGRLAYTHATHQPDREEYLLLLLGQSLVISHNPSQRTPGDPDLGILKGVRESQGGRDRPPYSD